MGSSSHAGLSTSHAGSSTLLAQHSSLLKTSSTCLNDMIQHSHPHPANHYSQQGSNGSILCKADGWVPSRTMMDDNPSYLYHHHHHHHNNQGQFRSSSNQGDEQAPPLSPPPSQQAQRQQQQQNVPDTESTSPLPTSSNRLFSSPLMQHITRPYHSTKFRRWFKRHNKVTPLVNEHH